MNDIIIHISDLRTKALMLVVRSLAGKDDASTMDYIDAKKIALGVRDELHDYFMSLDIKRNESSYERILSEYERSFMYINIIIFTLNSFINGDDE